MIERRIREALDALTGGEVPDDLGSAGVAGRFRRRQRRNRVGGVVASAVFVGAAVVGVSQFTGSDAVAVTTAGTERESLDESGADSAQVPPETTMGPTDSESSGFGLIVAARSDGPFEWSRLEGADPTLDVILGLQFVGPGARAARYAATNQVLGTVGLTEGAESLASIVLQLVQIDGSRDVPPFDLTIAALIDADNIVRYKVSATDSPRAGCTTSGLIEKRGVLFALDIEPSAPACEGQAHRLFDGEFALEVNIDEQVTVTSATGQVAVFRVGSTLPPSSAGGELGLLISNDDGVLLYDPLSGSTTSVVETGRPVFQAAISPDGSSIAYIEEQDDRFALLVSERGSDEALLVFDHAPGVIWLSWSPDGTRLAFSALTVGGGTSPDDGFASLQVWVVELESLAAERIGDSGIAAFAPPRWSPDGSQLLILDLRSPTDGFVLVDESLARDTVDVGMPVLFPIWSPDGERIAFVSVERGSSDLWSVAPDGSGLTRLTDIGFEIALPTWSPDGTKIAFLADTDEGPILYVVGSDGEVLMLFAELPILPADDASSTLVWSPDSTQIAALGLGEEVVIVDSNSGARRFTGQFGQPNDWR